MMSRLASNRLLLAFTNKETAAVENQRNKNKIVSENKANDELSNEEPTCSRNISQFENSTEGRSLLKKYLALTSNNEVDDASSDDNNYKLNTDAGSPSRSDEKQAKKRKVLNKTEIVQEGKKRQRHYEQWKSTQRHLKHLAGEKYVNKRGKIIEERKLKPPCHCRMRCYEKISEDVRMSIFKSYWDASKSHDLKRQYIRRCITVKITERSRIRDGSRRRENSLVYTFPVNGNDVQICQVMFLNTLSISNTVVATILKNEEIGGFIRPDQRGRHVPSTKIPEQVTENVVEHIASFPSYESQNKREKKKMKYLLNPDLNLEMMYRLYLQFCAKNKIDSKFVAKKWFYVETFHKKFNLSFKMPSSQA